MKKSRFISCGSAVPSKVLTNYDLEQIVETTDEWITERTGIKTRFICNDDKENVLSLAYQAAKQAIANADINPEEVGLIILATETPHQVVPSTACLLQGRLGIKSCIAFDIQAACSGFIYAMSIADQFIRGTDMNDQYALVIGSETYSRAIDWSDRATCVLFGDGAAAMLFKADNQPGIHATKIYSDGRHANCLEIPWGLGQGYGSLREDNRFVKMDGRVVFKNAVLRMTNIIPEVVEEANLSLEDINWVVPHQANIRIIDAIADKLSVSKEKFIITVEQHGNTSAASIPLAFSQAYLNGQIKTGETILFNAFGAGFTWGAAIMTV